MKTKLEYIWLDGYFPTQNMRSKTKVVEDFDGSLEGCPMWSFDGSSTRQAVGGSSDCLLKPVAIFPDPERDNAYLVMTDRWTSVDPRLSHLLDGPKGSRVVSSVIIWFHAIYPCHWAQNVLLYQTLFLFAQRKRFLL